MIVAATVLAVGETEVEAEVSVADLDREAAAAAQTGEEDTGGWARARRNSM